MPKLNRLTNNLYSMVYISPYNNFTYTNEIKIEKFFLSIKKKFSWWMKRRETSLIYLSPRFAREHAENIWIARNLNIVQSDISRRKRVGENRWRGSFLFRNAVQCEQNLSVWVDYVKMFDITSHSMVNSCQTHHTWYARI